MKAVFIGSDPGVAEMARASIRICWPEALPQVATRVSEGLRLVKETSPDVVLLQASPPDIPVFEAILEMRSYSRVPLLVLGGQHDETELMTCLELGADDYISLPYDSILVRAHIWALMRRVYGAQGTVASCWNPVINPASRQVFLN